MITERDIKYLKIAESVAKLSNYPRVHIGSILVQKHEVISVGFNQTKTHPEQCRCNQILEYKKQADRIHAEISCLIKAQRTNYNINGSTLYVFRMGLNNKYECCKPCLGCQKKIKECGVKRVVYTVHNGIMEMVV